MGSESNRAHVIADRHHTLTRVVTVRAAGAGGRAGDERTTPAAAAAAVVAAAATSGLIAAGAGTAEAAGKRATRGAAGEVCATYPEAAAEGVAAVAERPRPPAAALAAGVPLAAHTVHTGRAAGLPGRRGRGATAINSHGGPTGTTSACGGNEKASRVGAGVHERAATAPAAATLVGGSLASDDDIERPSCHRQGARHLGAVAPSGAFFAPAPWAPLASMVTWVTPLGTVKESTDPV